MINKFKIFMKKRKIGKTITGLDPFAVVKLQRKSRQLSKDLKNPKFRAKAKLKDYKGVL